MSSALSKFTAFFHRQFGSPSAELDQAVEGITEHVEQAIAARIEPLEKRIAELTGGAPVAADGADPFAEIRQEMADLRARFDAIEIPPAPDLEALHQRLAAVEAAATKAAPARAAAPAAKPAVTTA